MKQQKKKPYEEFFEKYSLKDWKMFFQRNYCEIEYNVLVYSFLRDTFHQNKESFDRNTSLFKKTFSNFYVLNHSTKDFKNRYFEVMFSYRDESRNLPENIGSLCEALKDTTKNSEEVCRFSYITKMLNLIDDKQYPIYDQYVAKALALRRHYSQTKEVKNRYSGYLNCYNEIKRIYLELLREYTNGPIRVFKKMFDCPNHSSERVLDVIIWEIGKNVARKEITDSIK